jgi:prolyl 4-hydroxylase
MTFLQILESKHFGTLKADTVLSYANSAIDFSNKWLTHALRSSCSHNELALALAYSDKWCSPFITALESFLSDITLADSASSVETIKAIKVSQDSGVSFSTQRVAIILDKLQQLQNQQDAKQLLSKYISISTTAVPQCQIDSIIATCEPHLKPVTLFGNVGHNSVDTQIRNNTHFPTPLPNDSIALALLERLTAIAANTPIQYAEPPVVLNYQPDQYYKWHYDYIYPHNEQISQQIAQFGQRVKTAIYYLNDNFLGGETEFKQPFHSVKPIKNSILIFDNADENNQKVKESLHRGNTLLTGEKWVFTLWFRNKPFWLRTGLL